MNRGNMVRGLIVSTFGVLSVIEALRLRPFRGSNPVGDDTFPFILGGALIPMGLVLAFRQGPVDPPVAWPEKSQRRMMILSVFILALYAAILPFLGYILSTFAAAAALFGLIGQYRWYWCLTMAGVSAFSLWQIFVVWLRMPFPSAFWVG